MLTAVTGTSATSQAQISPRMVVPGRARGFTLIEILVAIVIIGIVMSVAVMSLSLAGDDREIRREARRMMSLIQLAQDDAMMQGREFGLEVMTGSYRFVEYDPATAQWAEPLFDDSLRYWSLPEEIEISLFLEDQRVQLDEDPDPIDYETEAGTQREEYAPHLLIFSSGDATPFELHLGSPRRDDLRVAIRGDLLGNLELLSKAELDFE